MSREIDHLVSRIRREFVEMPGLCLTGLQAQRLWSLGAEACAATLGPLVRAGFLRQTGEGLFVRGDQARSTAPSPGDTTVADVTATPAGPAAAGIGR